MSDMENLIEKIIEILPEGVCLIIEKQGENQVVFCLLQETTEIGSFQCNRPVTAPRLIGVFTDMVLKRNVFKKERASVETFCSDQNLSG